MSVWKDLATKQHALTCTYIHFFLCVHVACVCSIYNEHMYIIMLLLLDVTTQVAIYRACVTSRHSGLQRTSVSHHRLYNAKSHPYLVSSCFYAIPIFLVPQFEVFFIY